MDRLFPGDKLRSIPAETWNRFVSAAEFAERERGSGERPDAFAPSGIMVKNNSGGNIDRFEVLSLASATSPIDPSTNLASWKQQVLLQGGTPGGSGEFFAIALEPIKSGSIGLCAVAGACWVKINVGSSGHTYATTGTVTTKLTSTATANGSVRIVWKESGTGDKWAFVQLPIIDAAAGGTTIFVKELDGSPNFYASELHFDQADGFVVTNPSAGVARFDITAASSSTVGIVTTGTQTIAGDKTFTGNTAVGGTFTVTGAAAYLYCSAAISGNLTVGGIDVDNNGGGYASQTLLVRNKARVMGNLQVEYGDVDIETGYTKCWGDTYLAFGIGSGLSFFGLGTPAFFQGPINHVPSSGAGATYTSAEQTMLDDLVTAVNAILTAFEAYGLL